MDHVLQSSLSTQLTLFDPSAARYTFSSPRYDNGGCCKLSQSSLISVPVSFICVSDSSGNEAASWMTRSICIYSFINEPSLIHLPASEPKENPPNNPYHQYL